jgi:hypothetical protein
MAEKAVPEVERGDPTCQGLSTKVGYRADKSKPVQIVGHESSRSTVYISLFSLCLMGQGEVVGGRG